MHHTSHISPEMRACIDECLRCHAVCLGMASGHCLEAGGPHVAPPHFRLMLTCAETCRAAASVMLIGTDLHRSMCRTCAEACEACAQSCEGLDGMEECIAACRRCAQSCRAAAT